VLVDSAGRVPAPYRELRRVIDAGLLPCTEAAWGRLPGGDCEILGRLLIEELADVARLKHDWCLFVGDCERIGQHFWNEADDAAGATAFDLSHGDRRLALVMPAAAYVAKRAAQHIRLVMSVETMRKNRERTGYV
jgi:hypothetical protein